MATEEGSGRVGSGGVAGEIPKSSKSAPGIKGAVSLHDQPGGGGGGGGCSCAVRARQSCLIEPLSLTCSRWRPCGGAQGSPPITHSLSRSQSHCGAGRGRRGRRRRRSGGGSGAATPRTEGSECLFCFACLKEKATNRHTNGPTDVEQAAAVLSVLPSC